MQFEDVFYGRHKLYIIPPQFLPIPAVKGGAVETLIELFVKQNELHQKFNIICFSTYDERAFIESQNYKYTKFIYINNLSRINKFKYQFSRVFNKLFNVRPYCLDVYHGYIYKYLKRDVNNSPNDDYSVLVEGGSCVNELKKISKFVSPKRMFLHVHRNLTTDHYDYNAQVAVELFDHLIAVSKYTENTWNRNKHFIHSVVVPNAVDTSLFNNINSKQISDLRDKLGFKEDDFVVLFCGRLTEVKGIRELIQAIIRIDNSKIKLLVIGSSNFDGADLTPFQREIQKYAFEEKDRIIFTGFIHNSELAKYYSVSQVVAIPSIYEDPFPLVKLEAMASAKPLIISNSGGIPECVPESGRLLVVKEREDFVDQIKNAILNLYDNPELCKEMGAINLEAVKVLSKDNYYFNLNNVIYKN